MTPQEKEELFLQFVDSYVTFLIYVCNHSLLGCKNEQRNCRELEFNIKSSLTLMWQLHVTNSSLKSSYLEINFAQGASLISNREQLNRVASRLKQLKKNIACTPCFQTKNKRYCLSLIDQILFYYHPNGYAIFENNFKTEPLLTDITESR